MKKNQKNLACDWIALSKKIGTTTVSFLIEAKKTGNSSQYGNKQKTHMASCFLVLIARDFALFTVFLFFRSEILFATSF